MKKKKKEKRSEGKVLGELYDMAKELKLESTPPIRKMLWELSRRPNHRVAKAS